MIQSTFLRLIYFALVLVSLVHATPIDDAPEEARAPKPQPDAMRLVNAIHVRQIAPSSYTTSREANTENAPPPITQSSSSVEAVTSRVSNNQIVPSAVTSDAPIVTTDSRTANNQNVFPSTQSTGLAMPTGAVRIDAVLGGVAVGLAGIV